jgi:circadian clock protein KaiB
MKKRTQSPKSAAKKPSARRATSTLGAPRRAAPALVRASPEPSPQVHVLKLYVTGVTLASTLAIERVNAFCEKHLPGRYQLEVIDIYQLPALARQEQIVATPTLIRVLPPPLRRLIGTLADEEKILFGLDLSVR